MDCLCDSFCLLLDLFEVDLLDSELGGVHVERQGQSRCIADRVQCVVDTLFHGEVLEDAPDGVRRLDEHPRVLHLAVGKLDKHPEYLWARSASSTTASVGLIAASSTTVHGSRTG